MAAKNALKMVNDRIVKVMGSCAAGSAPGPVGVTVSIALVTMIDESLSKKRIESLSYETMERVVVEHIQ